MIKMVIDMDYSILINKDTEINNNLFKLDLVPVPKDRDHFIDKQTLVFWKKLKQAAENDKIYLIIDDAYRSIDAQQEILSYYINEIGIEESYKKVAILGTSEHHTGLAIDKFLTKNNITLEEYYEQKKKIIK